jgi:hypothetical protein
VKDQIVRFLCDPIRTGAYCARLTVPYQTIIDLWQFTREVAKKKKKRFRVEKPEADREYFKFMSTSGYPYFLDRVLDALLSSLIELGDICPKEVRDWADYGSIVINPLYYSEEDPELRKEDVFFFAPQSYFEDIKDAIGITIDDKAGPDFVAEVSSLTPKALSKFENFVRAIPCLESKIVLRDEGRQHSQRSVYNLYPAVEGLWIDTIAHKSISRDTIDYLSEAVSYIDKKEWRMVIILCALSTEGILADIFEDVTLEESPEEPLGALMQDIGKKRKLPPNVLKSLNTLNDIRNNALHHKGLASLTRKEALLSLINATKFALWWSFNCKDFNQAREMSNLKS